MSWRTIIELAQVMVGLGAAAGIGALSAWSYPLGRYDIWTITFVVMVLAVLSGIRPVSRAWRADRARRAERPAHG